MTEAVVKGKGGPEPGRPGLWVLDYSPLFFDFDGLLVNTERLHFQAYQNTCCHYQIPFPWDFSTFTSVAHQSAEGLRHLLTTHAPHLGEGEGWARFYQKKTGEYERLLDSGGVELMPGVSDILQQVREAGVPHAVVTNSTRRQTDKVREKIPHLSAIPHWVTREDYPRPKPAPDAYLVAIDRLGGSKNMLGFEDTLRGVHALKGAGIVPVLICSPNHPQLAAVAPGSVLYFSSFSALLTP